MDDETTSEDDATAPGEQAASEPSAAVTPDPSPEPDRNVTPVPTVADVPFPIKTDEGGYGAGILTRVWAEDVSDIEGVPDGASVSWDSASTSPVATSITITGAPPDTEVTLTVKFK